MQRPLLTSATVALCIVLSSQAYPNDTIFWVDNDLDTLRSMSTDGSDNNLLRTTGNHPVGIVVDAVAGKVYWTSTGPTVGEIHRANLDGSGIEVVYAAPAGEFIAHLALDTASGKIYWTDIGESRVRRGNMNGGGVETLVGDDLRQPYGIALDLSRGKLYWTDWLLEKVERANLDGSDREELYSGTAYTLALDTVTETIYVADYFGHRVYSVGFDGSGQRDLVTTETVSPRGIALLEEHIYWTDTGPGNPILRADLDGGNVVTILETGDVRDPSGIDVVSLENEPTPRFLRGDPNTDSKVDIGDIVWIVEELFRGGAPTPCKNAADADDDGVLTIADALFLVDYRYLHGPPPPSPFPLCGLDDAADDPGCESYPEEFCN